MERYTFIDKNGFYIDGANGEVRRNMRSRFYGKAIDRLAAYEDTGLEPEEISGLQAPTECSKLPKWISVENELPKNELRTYWVYTSVGSQHSCRWTNNRFGLGVSDKWGWSVFDIPQHTVVTHWMNLPEPPKEDDDA